MFAYSIHEKGRKCDAVVLKDSIGMITSTREYLQSIEVMEWGMRHLLRHIGLIMFTT